MVKDTLKQGRPKGMLSAATIALLNPGILAKLPRLLQAKIRSPLRIAKMQSTHANV
jgi:hypothetical protein